MHSAYIICRLDPSSHQHFLPGEYMKDVREEVKKEMLIDIDYARVRSKAGESNALRTYEQI